MQGRSFAQGRCSLTTDLVRAIERVSGGPRYGQIHPATRTFQALRIYVNDELKSLESFLDSSMGVVRPGGRVVVIAFHSLEDRIVKQKFRAPAVPGRVLTKKVVTGSDEEVQRNPRARSAKLRAWERSLMAIEVHFEKRIINNHVIREADVKSHRDYIVVTVLAAMFLFGLFAYGWQHYQWTQYGYRIEEAQKKKEQLAEIGRQLVLENETLRNPQRIDSIARRELGYGCSSGGTAGDSECGCALDRSPRSATGAGASAAACGAGSETLITRLGR